MRKERKSQESPMQRSWTAMAYLRLSKEDGEREESNSIRGQREAIGQFVKNRPEITLVGEQADDGWSGSTFDRPGFLSLMEAVHQGEANCVIVKDLSRFGRNYIEAGRYIETLFPQLGVRFIAINDGYDSVLPQQGMDSILLPFKNLINDAYCRDISGKIRSQLEVKRRNGAFIGSYAPYGYEKDPANHNRLIIDSCAAEVVRKIFRWRIEGMSQTGIAKRLNEMSIPSPAVYKQGMGLSYVCGWQRVPGTATGEEARWSATTVGNILKNQVYLGKAVQGKSRTPNFRVKKRVSLPPGDWILVEDCQEPIVTQECFNQVQHLLSTQTRVAEGREGVYLFSGFLICGGCGGSMIRQRVSSRGKTYLYYQCANHKNCHKVCGAHSIDGEGVEKGLLELFRHHEDLLPKTNWLTATRKESQNGGEEALKTAIAAAVQQGGVLYEDFKEGLLDQEEYEMLKKRYRERRKGLEALLVKCTAPPSEVEVLERIFPKKMELDRLMLTYLLEGGTVFEGKRVEFSLAYSFLPHYLGGRDE